jgi:hypothetical protein
MGLVRKCVPALPRTLFLLERGASPAGFATTHGQVHRAEAARWRRVSQSPTKDCPHESQQEPGCPARPDREPGGSPPYAHASDEEQETECRSPLETIGRLSRAAPAPWAHRPRRLFLSFAAHPPGGKTATPVFRPLAGTGYLHGSRGGRPGGVPAHRPRGATPARTQHGWSCCGSAPARRDSRWPR